MSRVGGWAGVLLVEVLVEVLHRGAGVLDWNCMQRIYQLWRVTTPCRALKHYPSPRLTQIDCYRSNPEKSQHHQPPCCFWLRDRCEELRKGRMCHLKPN